MLDFDELNGYEYTDKVVRHISLRFIRLFNQIKALRKKKERELIDDFYDFYMELLTITEDAYLKIAKHYYVPDHKKTTIDKKWVEKQLNAYDPVAKYIFMQEVERKRSRHLEAFIASDTPEAETDTALRHWSNMVRQFADNITDAAYNQALADDGEKKVVWCTEKDNRVCKICHEREGVIYQISKVPPKPHFGCRCWLRSANG